MLRKSRNQKKKSKVKSRKRSQKVIKRKSIRKKSYLPTAAIAIPIAVGSIGLLSAYGYYYELPKYKQQVEKQYNKNIEEFKKEIKEKINLCSICHEGFSTSDTVELNCKHKFHAKCMQDMIKHNPYHIWWFICPNCRQTSSYIRFYIKNINPRREGMTYFELRYKDDINYDP